MNVHGTDRHSTEARKRWGGLLIGGLVVASWLASGSALATEWVWQNTRPAPSYMWGTVAFLDSEVGMIVGSGPGATILRTGDGGVTWVDSTGDLRDLWCPTSFILTCGLSFIDADTATVVGTDVGVARGFIARTDDAGATWTRQGTSLDLPAGTMLTDVAFANASSGIAVGWLFNSQPVIVRTTDSGNSWSPASQISDVNKTNLFSVAFVDSSTAVAVGTGSLSESDNPNPGPRILRTTDGGDTWNVAYADGGGFGNRLWDVDCATENICKAVGWGGTILATSDGGLTWTPETSGTTQELKGISCIDANTCISVGGHPTFESSGRVVVRTVDGGNTWTTSVFEEQGATLWGVAFHSEDNATAVGRTGHTDLNERGGSILRSADGGATWTRQTRNFVEAPEAEPVIGATFNSVAFTNATNGVVVGHTTAVGAGVSNNGLILRTADGGNTWVDETPGPLLDLHDIALPGANVGFAVGKLDILNVSEGCNEALLLKSADGGSSWVDHTDSLPADEYARSRQLLAAHFTDANTGTVVGGVFIRPVACPEEFGPIILRTTDGGASWSVQSASQPGPPYVFNDVFFSDTDAGTVVGMEGTILRTTDGGATWTPQSSGTSANLLSVFFLDGNQGWVVGPGVMLETGDGGATWANATPSVLPAGAVLRDVAFRDSDNGVAVGDLSSSGGGLVLTTVDGGTTWEVEEGKPARVTGAGSGFNRVAFAGSDAVVVGRGSHPGVILRGVDDPTFLPMDVEPPRTAMCGLDGSEASVRVGIGSVGGYVGTVALATFGEPAGVSSVLEPSSVSAPGSVTWTLSGGGDVTPGQHVVTVSGDDGNEQHFANLLLEIIDAAQVPAPLEPAKGAIDVALQPTFSWEAIPGIDRYRIQVATDEGFGTIVIDEEVFDRATFTPPGELVKNTQFFWRVQGIHECLDGTWSGVFSFTTADLLPELATAPEALGFEVPIGGSEGAALNVTNVGTGNLTWNMQTADLPAVTSSPRTKHQSARTTTPRRSGVAGGGDRMAVVDLASVLGRPLPGLRPVIQAHSPADCDSEPGLILHDDGTVENGYSGTAGQVDSATFVDRFTPSAYPASFSGVCVAFVSNGPTSLDFEIVVFDDDGPEGSPGTELGALPVSADGIPGPDSLPQPVWLSLDISSLGVTIDSGSAYVGVRWTPTSPNVFIASDESPENPPGFAGGYVTTGNTDEWAPLEGPFPAYRSLLVRAVEIPAGCQDPTTLPWLTVTPNAGNVPPGSSTPVTVTVDTATLGTGTYSANLCLHSNDPDRPLVGVPVDLSVVGSDLTLDAQGLDFGNVFVDTTSAPQLVTLHNVGNRDATGLAFQLTGNGFEADTSACGATLAVGASCQVSVTFTPTESGPTEGTLQATSDTGLPVVLSLTGNGVRETEVFTPIGLEVDLEPIISDANGVFEPGELAPVAPVWRHDGVAPQDVTGTASDLTGPEGPTYSLLAADADYGHVEPGATAGCQESEACYEMDIGPAGVPRPAPHWDATFQEVLSDDTSHEWTLHIGDSFVDVPRSSPFYPSVEALLHSGVTGGCTETEYCPAGLSSRAQMPVFMLKALEGPGYQPPACHEGAPTFADVPIDSPFCPWIKDLAERGVISGCGDGNYCPTKPVTRAQMAIFLLKTLEGEGYTPPACTGEFVDVPCSSAFAAWVEELAARGITGGCRADPPAYCPVTPVTRAQMATFVTRTFGLTLYGP